MGAYITWQNPTPYYRVLPTYHPLCCFLLLRQNTVPAKAKIPIDYTIEISFFLPDGMKRLFSWNEKQKKACTIPYHFPIIFLPFYPYTIWQNYRLLPNSFTFAKLYQIFAIFPYSNSIFRQGNTIFS